VAAFTVADRKSERNKAAPLVVPAEESA